MIKKKYRNIEIVNRTISNSKKIAEKFNLTYQSIELIYELMNRCDVMIFSTTSTKKLITTKKARSYLSQRKKPLLIVDLSVPTNVPKDIDTIDNIDLVNIDGLKDEVNKNYLKRKKEINSAKKLITKLVEEFDEWIRNKEIRNIINQFTKEFDQYTLDLNDDQNLLNKYKQNIITNIKSIKLNKNQDPLSIINNLLLKK